MSRVLGQLFATTELFEMKTRPELILLQKSMVLVEGVSRMLDPALDIWTVSEPVVGDWVRRSAGPIGRLEELGEHLERGSVAIGRLPALIDKAESRTRHLARRDFRRRAALRPVRQSRRVLDAGCRVHRTALAAAECLIGSATIHLRGDNSA